MDKTTPELFAELWQVLSKFTFLPIIRDWT